MSVFVFSEEESASLGVGGPYPKLFEELKGHIDTTLGVLHAVGVQSMGIGLVESTNVCPPIVSPVSAILPRSKDGASAKGIQPHTSKRMPVAVYMHTQCSVMSVCVVMVWVYVCWLPDREAKMFLHGLWHTCFVVT